MIMTMKGKKCAFKMKWCTSEQIKLWLWKNILIELIVTVLTDICRICRYMLRNLWIMCLYLREFHSLILCNQINICREETLSSYEYYGMWILSFIAIFRQVKSVSSSKFDQSLKKWWFCSSLFETFVIFVSFCIPSG